MLQHDLVKEILITEEQIQKRIIELVDEVENHYQKLKKPLLLVGILRGCLPFFSDFMMKLNIACAIDFMYVESYAGQITAFEPRIKVDLITNIENRDVLIVEDIIDSGKTLSKLVNYLQQRKPNSLKILTLLDKKEKRIANIEADWFGFTVPDKFLIGYGLDYQEILRNLPYVAVADLEKINNQIKKS